MNYKLEEIEIKNLDHLGIVAGIIDEIGIVEKVNELLGTDSREKINCGEVVKAIILNGLGFVAQPLYLFSNFFKDKAVEHLLGAGVKAEELNDDKLGRVMDKLYKYGLNNIFLIIGLSVIKKYKISKKILDRLEKEAEKARKEINKIIKLEFEQVSLALTAIEQIQAKLKYHQIVQIETFSKVNKKGQEIHTVTCRSIENKELVDDIKNQAGKFILATNILSETELETSEILTVYKQQQSCESGFRFLKDPLFFADSLFVKNPERVETMMMLMGLSLLVYTIGQRQIRNSLKARESSVKNQLNKATDRPTLRWIFQCFQGIHYFQLDEIERISNLTEERCRILEFLPEACQKYYLAN